MPSTPHESWLSYATCSSSATWLPCPCVSLSLPLFLSLPVASMYPSCPAAEGDLDSEGRKEERTQVS
jgi:hypothetical protein